MEEEDAMYQDNSHRLHIMPAILYVNLTEYGNSPDEIQTGSI